MLNWLINLEWGIISTFVAATFVALLTWRTHNIVSRRRTTYESIQRKYWDVDYVIARRMFNDYRENLSSLDDLDDFFNPPHMFAKKVDEAETKAKNLSSGKGVKPKDKPMDSSDETRLSVFAKPREFVGTILNDYELFAIGIENGVIDEEIAKSLVYGTVMNDYATCRRFIQHLRDKKNNPRIFIKFEMLYERWKKCPPNPKRVYSKLNKRNWWLF